MVFVLDNYDSFTYNLVQYMGELGAEVVVRRNDELTPEEVEAMRPERILLSPGPCTPEDAGISIALIRHFARRMEEGGAETPILGVCLGHQAIGAAFGGKVVRAEKLMHGKTSEVEHDGRTIFADVPSAMTCTRYHSLIVAEEGLPEELEISARVAGKGTVSAVDLAEELGVRARDLVTALFLRGVQVTVNQPLNEEMVKDLMREFGDAAGEALSEGMSKKKSKKKADSDSGGDASDAGTIMGLRHRSLPIEGVQFHPESVLTTHGKKIIANFLKM